MAYSISRTPFICVAAASFLALPASADALPLLFAQAGAHEASVVFMLSGMSWPGPSSAVVSAPLDALSGGWPDPKPSSSADGFAAESRLASEASILPDAEAAESSGVMTSIMVAFALGALLKMMRSPAWLELISGIYYPEKY